MEEHVHNVHYLVLIVHHHQFAHHVMIQYINQEQVVLVKLHIT
jgi:hypothetical protein